MKYIIKFAAAMFCENNTQSAKTDTPVFPQGEKVTNSNFTGTVYVQLLTNIDSLNQTAEGNACLSQEPEANGTYIRQDKYYW